MVLIQRRDDRAYRGRCIVDDRLVLPGVREHSSFHAVGLLRAVTQGEPECWREQERSSYHTLR